MTLRSMLALVASVAAAGSATAQSTDPLLPPSSKPGECYARVLVPDRYESFTETVEVQPQKTVIETVPASYEWDTKEVLVQPEHFELKLIPARFEVQEETIVVKEASKKIVASPAKYKTVTEKVLVAPAHVAWKKGRGLIERIDDATGEILCRVEVPAKYETYTRQVLVEEAGVREEVVPAVTKVVKKKVMVEPPRTDKIVIPAKYQTVRFQKLVTPARQARETIPAKLTEVTKERRVSEGRMEWRSVLCETNAGSVILSDLQRALVREGYDPGSIDGVIGNQTMAALGRFQRARKLPAGKITIETLEALGVRRN